MGNKPLSLFLDCGAYSALTQGAPLDLKRYIKFIKKHKDHFDHYSVLDDISDPEKTLNNQARMEIAGLKPVPCFHYNEPTKYLIHYIDHYNYISLGGMVPIATSSLRFWLDHLFSKYICDEDGMPKVKIHGFGMSSHDLMIRFPWYSVDSTGWVMTGHHGAIYVPKTKGWKYDYSQKPHTVDVSNKSGTLKHIGKHILNFSPNTQRYILDYIESKNYKLGTSEIKTVEKGYKPGKNEKWFDRKNLQLEVVVVEGVMNSHRLRGEMNIIYYHDFEDSLPKWPWKFKLGTPKRFGQ